MSLRKVYILLALLKYAFVMQGQQAVVQLKPSIYKLALEPFTSVYQTTKPQTMPWFIKDNWKGFKPCERETFFMKASLNYTYLKINFQNHSSTKQDYVVQLKESVLPHVHFYWYNIDRDTCYELIADRGSRTPVIRIPSLKKLSKGILLIELQSKSNSTLAPIYLFLENVYYDFELNFIFAYSLFFGVFILELILIIYSIYLSKKRLNLYYCLAIFSIILYLFVTRGYIFMVQDSNWQMPAYAPLLIYLIGYIFLILFFHKLFQPDVSKWMSRITLSLSFLATALIFLMMGNTLWSAQLSEVITVFLVVVVLSNAIFLLQKAFVKYVYFTFGLVLAALFYCLNFALVHDFLPNTTLTYYGFDLALCLMTLFITIGLIRNVFSERLMGERLIKENQIVLIEQENKLNAHIEEENKALLNETDEFYKQINNVKQTIQQKRIQLKQSENTINEIETIIRSADILIEDAKSKYFFYLNLSDDQIALMDSANGDIRFTNAAMKRYFNFDDTDAMPSVFKLFSEKEKETILTILNRVFNGYYYLSVLETPVLATGEVSSFNYQFIPIKRNNGKVVMALMYAIEAS